MKKKYIVLCIALVLASISLMLSVLFLLQKIEDNKELEVGEFDLTYFQWEIETFPYEKNVGPIDNADVAIEKARSVWLERYGNNKYLHDNFDKWGRFQVDWDPLEECWYVHSVPPPDWVGGVSNVIIRKNGDVIAVWPDD